MKTPILLTVILSAALSITAQARTWTQATTNRTVEAEYVGVQGTNVMLKLANGRTVPVAINTLSDADKEFIKQQMASASSSGSSSGSASWPQWRGPNQDNVSTSTGLLKEWPEGGPEKLWTYSDAGMGYSSFSFAEGKLFTLGTRRENLMVIAVDAGTGEEVWASRVSSDDKEGYNSGWGHGPRSTPTYSEGMIYVLGPKGTLACFTAADGSEQWSHNLGSKFGGQAGNWGFSESPLVDGDKVIIAPGGGRSPLVALKKDSGDVVWTADIPDAGPAEYATVVAADINGKRQYIKLFQKKVVGVDAEDGSVLWTSDWSKGRTAVIPTPIVDGNRVYITSGYGAGSKMIEIEGGQARDVWESGDMKNHHGGVVKIGDHIYGFSDGPGLMCQSWETGELVWNERGRYTSKGSIHAAEGMIYCLNEGDGTITLAEATPSGFEATGQFTMSPQSENRHPQGKIWSHPVVIDGKLYLRDQEHISCYNIKADS